MAYNLIAETNLEVDWFILNRVLVRFTDYIEFFPIITEDYNNSIAISIPLKFLKPFILSDLKKVLVFLLENEYKVFDLYSGNSLSLSGLDDFLSSILN